MNDFNKLDDIMENLDNADLNNIGKDVQPIPKELIDRSKIQEGLIFISEQDIPTICKVSLLIGYGISAQRNFSYQEIEFALTTHEKEDVGTK